MIAVEGICVPRAFVGRSNLGLPQGSVFLRSRAEHEWLYLSVTPNIYTLEDFWEESSSLRSSLEELVEESGG